MARGEQALGQADAAIRFRPGRGRHELPAWLVMPAGPPRGAPVVAVHGITRNAEGMALRLAAQAAALGRVIVAPLFAEDAYKGYQRVFGPRRADLALLALLDALGSEAVIDSGAVDLAGFSGGAQFAHRFAWLYPHRVGRLTVAAAGWWTFPDASAWPCGLGGDGPARWLRANTADFLDREIAVAVGERDCIPDRNTRSGAAIDAQQGTDRLIRARRWTAALSDAAERFGLEPRISLSILPGAGHDFAACADAGLDRLILPTPR